MNPTPDRGRPSTAAMTSTQIPTSPDLARNTTSPELGTDALLVVDDISLHYGAIRAVDGVSLQVERGGRHALIGPNGAGKSSLFSVLAGATSPTAGTLHFDGQDVTDWDEVALARAGLVRTFQHSSLFLRLTVLDNVRLAVERTQGRPLRPWPSRRDREVTDEARAHLETVGLAARSAQIVSSLSHGERRQLEVAVVLACKPRLVLFDEPTAGMSAAETARFADLVEALPEHVTTIIVEHDLDVVFRLARSISVLAAGQLIASGTADEVRANPRVQEAYLGAAEGRDPLFFDQPDGSSASISQVGSADADAGANSAGDRPALYAAPSTHPDMITDGGATS